MKTIRRWLLLVPFLLWYRPFLIREVQRLRRRIERLEKEKQKLNELHAKWEVDDQIRFNRLATTASAMRKKIRDQKGRESQHWVQWNKPAWWER